MEGIGRDLLYGLRMLRQRPVAAAIAVVAFGLAIGAGATPDEAERSIGQVVEGRAAAAAAAAHARRLGVEMPITEEVVRVLSGRTTPSDAVRALLAREARVESG